MDKKEYLKDEDSMFEHKESFSRGISEWDAPDLSEYSKSKNIKIKVVRDHAVISYKEECIKLDDVIDIGFTASMVYISPDELTIAMCGEIDNELGYIVLTRNGTSKNFKKKFRNTINCVLIHLKSITVSGNIFILNMEDVHYINMNNNYFFGLYGDDNDVSIYVDHVTNHNNQYIDISRDDVFLFRVDMRGILLDIVYYDVISTMVFLSRLNNGNLLVQKYKIDAYNSESCIFSEVLPIDDAGSFSLTSELMFNGDEIIMLTPTNIIKSNYKISRYVLEINTKTLVRLKKLPSADLYSKLNNIFNSTSLKYGDIPLVLELYNDAVEDVYRTSIMDFKYD